jgi:hypothetical protein
MANSRTVGDNAPISVADRIRKNTNSQIQTTLKAPVKTAINAFKGLSAAEQNRRSVRAAAAMLRATQDNTYYPSQQTLTDYAALVDTVATLRGIKPAGTKNNKNQFSEEQLNTDLSPQALLRYAAARTLTEEAYKEHMVAGRQAVADEIKDVYDDDEEKSQPVVNSIKDVPPYLDDKQILELPEDERAAYMKDPVDAARLQKKLDDKKSTQSKNLDDKTLEVKNNMDDPDWGHKDDDDFKIEQGDIIEYLMKDVILASAAWAGNRAAGLLGTVGYEVGRGGWHLAKKGAFRPIGKALSGAWAYTRETLNGHNKIREKLKNDKAALQNFEALNDKLAEDYAVSINQAKKVQDDYINHPNPEMETLFRQVAQHYVLIGNDSLTFPMDEEKGIKGAKRAHSYDEILGKHETPEAVDQFKNNLHTMQKNFDQAILNGMLEKEKANLGRDLTPDEITQITEWQKNFNANCEDAVRNNSKTTPYPDPAQYGDHKKSFEASQQEVMIQLYLRPQMEIFKAQTLEFVTNYSHYKLLEERRKNPDATIFQDEAEQARFLDKYKREGEVIFYQAEQQRRTDKSIPSREDLLEMSAKMYNSSLELLKNNKNENEVPDTILNKLGAKLNLPTDENTKDSIIDAAKKISAQDFMEDARNNLDREEKSLIQQQQLNGERGRRLQEFKERLKNTDERIKSDPTTNRAPLKKVNADMSYGHN